MLKPRRLLRDGLPLLPAAPLVVGLATCRCRRGAAGAPGFSAVSLRFQVLQKTAALQQAETQLYLARLGVADLEWREGRVRRAEVWDTADDGPRVLVVSINETASFDLPMFPSSRRNQHYPRIYDIVNSQDDCPAGRAKS